MALPIPAPSTMIPACGGARRYQLGDLLCDIRIIDRFRMVDAHVPYGEARIFEHEEQLLLHFKSAMVATDGDGAIGRRCGGRFAIRHLDDFHAALFREVARGRA